jgi:hypothetical protein
MEWFFTSALNLTFSPGEKEQPQAGSGFADDCPANPVAGFAERRRMILLPQFKSINRACCFATVK